MKASFRIEYHTSWGESLCLISGDDVKYPMRWTPGDVWEVSIDHCPKKFFADYYYVVMEDGLISRTEWDHHHASPCETIEDHWIDCPIPGCPFPRRHSAEIFDRPQFRGAGTAVPIFSLRTSDDFGIGDFRDLRPLVDWAAATGQCIIQLLPINDTTRKGTWDDSYPYSPVSSFALHPLYIRLQEIGVPQNAAFKKLQKELNSLPELDYPRVFKEKMALIRQAYEKCGSDDSAKPSYRRFCKSNAYWLDEYATFCAERDSLEPDYYRWIQWHLDRQLSSEVKYAHSKGVYLKGDLPIGVSGDSADAHWHPELFNLDSSAGAPPDFFSRDGQNWGFPTYNWEAMAADDYAWWKSRLRKMSEYFDAFRIDHILGFFRIWEIPVEYKSGLMGHFNPALPYSSDEIISMGLPFDGLFNPDPRHPHCWQPLITPDTSALQPWQKEKFDALYNDFFYHRHDEFWRRNAMRKLPELLGATGMLACGEDLGMVPDCVPGVMDHEKILSLEMMQMEKGRPWPYLSVCATSSHDMSTLRMQKAENESTKGLDMSPDEIKDVLWSHLRSSSMLAIFPLQDWVALDPFIRRQDYMNERINQPADPHHHWRYRFHCDLGELLEAASLNSELRSMLDASGRVV